jgi:hypothetical protein
VDGDVAVVGLRIDAVEAVVGEQPVDHGAEGLGRQP